MLFNKRHASEKGRSCPALTIRHLRSILLFLMLTALWQIMVPSALATVISDPSGDTFGTGPVQPDITGVSANFNESAITFTVDFQGTIFPPSAHNARSVYGFIDIDTDRNPSTGAPAWVNVLAPPSAPIVALGDEYWLDLFSEEVQPGRVDVVNQMSDVVGTAPIIYETNALFVTVPLSLIANSDGLVNYGVIVGTFSEATDRAPNGSVPLTSTPVPEPATLLLLVSSILVFAVFGKQLREKLIQIWLVQSVSNFIKRTARGPVTLPEGTEPL